MKLGKRHLIAEKAADGSSIPSATITMRRDGGTQIVFLEYELTDVRIGRTRMATSGALPIEEVGLSFDRIKWAYSSQSPDGTPGDKVQGCFDVANNAAC